MIAALLWTLKVGVRRRKLPTGPQPIRLDVPAGTLTVKVDDRELNEVLTSIGPRVERR